ESDLCTAPRTLQQLKKNGIRIDRVVFDFEAADSRMRRELCKARELFCELDAKSLALLTAATRSKAASFGAADFDGFLIRPVRPKALLQQIFAPGTSHSDRNEQDDPGVAANEEFGLITEFDTPGCAVHSDGTTRHILVVEDNEINALLARRVIEKAGCSISVVTNGRQALDYLQRAAQDPSQPTKPAHEETGSNATSPPAPHWPDLVLMDILMPEMDGVEAAQRIRQAHGSDLPIVALTASAFEKDRQRFLADGFDDYLAKPFEVEQLMSVIGLWSTKQVMAG
ncbi:MAG: response regulator, partial [Pseudomonadota bacterium]